MADSKLGRAGPTATYQLSPFASSTSTSPPTPAFRADIFGQVSSPTSAQTYGTSPTAERHPNDRSGAAIPVLSTSASDPISFVMDTRPAPAVVIRRLPRNISTDALRSMLIFAGDLIDTEFIRSPYPEDQGFATAVARFQTSAGALEAQQKLHGKPNTTKEATMIVEVHTGSTVGAFERRNTIDIPPSSRTQTSSASSGTSGGAAPSRSRFGSAFQANDKLSPPLSPPGNGEFPMPENSAHFQNLFSPQSPLGNGVDGQHRMSGKSIINDDAVDDETGELLKDPVAYAKSGQQPLVRRPTNPQIPISRFGNLSLNTNSGGSAMTNGLTSPRGVAAVQSAMSSLSPTNTTTISNSNSSNHHHHHHHHHNGGNGNNSSSNTNLSGMTPNGGYPYPRPQYPPVNPADQNPPCNTLYVGNLPIDTSEDELKALFSKQRGYKRLCFRTKQNGPMCFVEFEDVSFATKALHELYGHPLHNSVKGGIRLSFSKNPLGVRSGQTNGMGANAVMSPQAMSPTYGMMNGASFSSVSGPPPGLATPPGLVNGSPYRSPPPLNGMDGMFSAPFTMPPQGFVQQLSMRPYSVGLPPNLGSAPFGRDNHAGYDNSAPGR